MTNQEIAQINKKLTQATAQDIVAWAVKEFANRVTLASSFGAEDVALIDILSKAADSPRVFFLDTGRLHQQTYDLVDRVRAKYEIDIEVYFPRTDAIESLVSAKGTNSFYGSIENRKECCRVRKVEPLARALADVDAWITGLRRSQSLTRTELGRVESDEAHGGIVKINPLADWSEQEVWDYIRANGVPYNKLHDQGYPSIGCAPCTRAIQPAEDLRAGRWWWESPEQKECGLHIRDGKVVRP
ncbi:MAG: phosphoadenylyl-sulfate reductase [Chloroflexi bacterium]|nr:phosphoadenylyl-sulfate reductase [Chloroflexota bacterium]